MCPQDSTGELPSISTTRRARCRAPVTVPHDSCEGGAHAGMCARSESVPGIDDPEAQHERSSAQPHFCCCAGPRFGPTVGWK